MRRDLRPAGALRLMLAGLVTAGLVLLVLAANGLGPLAPAPARGPRAAQVRMAQAPDVAGGWADDRGYAYSIDQVGERYSFRLLRGGAEVGRGAGRIDGHVLVHQFASRAGAGTCTGTLDERAGIITMTCHKPAGALAFRLHRLD